MVDLIDNLSKIELARLLCEMLRRVRNNQSSTQRIGRTDLHELTQILIERLKEKGMGSGEIPGFIRNLTNALLANPHSNHLHMNEELHLLGWHDLDLDYRTFEVAKACCERGF